VDVLERESEVEQRDEALLQPAGDVGAVGRG
jgi:hypothetical protein